jgi:P-type Cu+ transporter
LRMVPQSLRLGSVMVRTIWQNLGWAFVYNIALIPLAAGVLIPSSGVGLPPEFAAAAMALSDVCVIGNSLLIPVRLGQLSALGVRE